MRHFLLVGTLVVGSFSVAWAYVPSTTNKSIKPLKWTGSNCIFLRINSQGSADINDGSDVAAVRSAVQRWANSAGGCSYLRFNVLDDLPDAKATFSRSGPNENTVSWVEKGWISERNHDRDAAGLTTVFFVDDPGSARDGKILDADVELNGEFFSFSAAVSGVAGKTDVENTVVHELGHVMGLDHPCDDGLRNPVPKDHLGETIPKCFPLGQLSQAMRDATMFNFADPMEVKKRTPETDDVLGICQTYPSEQNPGSCAPAETTPDTGCAAIPRSPRELPLTLMLLLFALAIGTLLRRRRAKCRRPAGRDA